MCTQIELATKVGITQQGVSDFVGRTGIDIKPMTPDEAVLAYCKYLRESAAGRGGSVDGEVFDLAAERAKTERLKQEDLKIRIQERTRELIPSEEFRRMFTPMMKAFRSNVLAIPGKVVQQFKALKGTTLEIEIIEDIVYDTLKSCSETDIERMCAQIEAAGPGGISTGQDDYD